MNLFLNLQVQRGEIHIIVYISVCQLGDKGEQATVPVYEATLLLKNVREDRQKQASLAKQLLK